MGLQGRHLNLLLDFASFRFMSIEYLRRHLPDPAVDLCAEDCTIELADYQAIVLELISEQQEQYLGLSYGMYLNLQALGLIHTISLEVTSIEQALLMLSEYLHSYFPFLQLHTSRKDTQIRFELRTDIKEERLRRFMLDSTYCFLYRELKTMGVSEVQLLVPQEDTLEYRKRLGQKVETGPYHTFIFDVAVVNEQINPRTMQLIDVLLPQYLLLLDREQGESFPAKVKRMLLQMSNPMFPTLSQVSAQFAMSDRNFQRKLRSSGQSFRSITNEVKHQLASYLREGGQMKVKDIAYALGYSEPSAYLHAVKNWERSQTMTHSRT